MSLWLSIAGHGRPCWCPGRLLRLLHADLQPGSGSIVQVNDQALIKPLVFYLQPLTLNYLRTRKPLTKVGTATHHSNRKELSFLPSLIRIYFQTDARESYFCIFRKERHYFLFALHIQGPRNSELNSYQHIWSLLCWAIIPTNGIGVICFGPQA